VVHRTPEGRETINAYGPWGRAAVLDGLLLMARGDYAARIEPLAPRSGFHFYDMELALRGLRAGLSHWTVPLLLEHRSGGAAADEEDYLRQRQAFEARFAGQLPVDVPPAPTPGVETP
jgi:hypothetical protein